MITRKDLPQVSARKEQTKASISQSFPERKLSAYFESYCLRARLLILQELGAGCEPPQRLRKLVYTYSIFSLQPDPIVKLSLPEGACTHIWCHSICGSHLRDGSLEHLALISNRSCIHGSHRTVGKKETLLNRCRSTPFSMAIHLASAQREQAKWPFPSYSFAET